MAKAYLQTGQLTCHDTSGLRVDCSGSGQDAEFGKGVPWPEPRFIGLGDTVLDRLTGLQWTRCGNLAEVPLSWQEALDFVKGMNERRALGHADWRMPNRREMRSLMSYQSRKPSLPEGHPFADVFLGWYWTSTTAAINRAYAWYVHLEGARMFYGEKRQYFLLWPVRGEGSGVLPWTGQKKCHDSEGMEVPCPGSGQDAEFRSGTGWGRDRFQALGDIVIDRLTDLCWMREADLEGRTLNWQEALDAVRKLNLKPSGGVWRLPNINELESLVDADEHSPALPEGHPFVDVREGYWSSTTSMFEPDWAWALYLTKGATGVGQKRGAYFHAWAVCDSEDMKRQGLI